MDEGVPGAFREGVFGLDGCEQILGILRLLIIECHMEGWVGSSAVVNTETQELKTSPLIAFCRSLILRVAKWPRIDNTS